MVVGISIFIAAEMVLVSRLVWELRNFEDTFISFGVLRKI